MPKTANRPSVENPPFIGENEDSEAVTAQLGDIAQRARAQGSLLKGIDTPVASKEARERVLAQLAKLQKLADAQKPTK